MDGFKLVINQSSKWSWGGVYSDSTRAHAELVAMLYEDLVGAGQEYEKKSTVLDMRLARMVGMYTQ